MYTKHLYYLYNFLKICFWIIELNYWKIRRTRVQKFLFYFKVIIKFHLPIITSGTRGDSFLSTTMILFYNNYSLDFGLEPMLESQLLNSDQMRIINLMWILH